jgi:copper chaperone CopZ
MSKTYFKMQQQFCGECSMALRRFIGGMDGVNAVDVDRGMVAVDFDEQKIPEESVRQIALDSIEKLGYRVEED